jgi:hypothetical protein
VTVTQKPSPELDARGDRVPLITLTIGEMKVKAILLLTMGGARGKPETHLSRPPMEQDPAAIAFKGPVQYGSPELCVALRILREERHRL